VIKRGAVKPNQTITKSTRRIVGNNQAREAKNSQKSAVSMDQSRVIEDEEEEWKMQLDDLADHAYKDCQEKLEKMEYLALYRINQRTFYVKVHSYKDYSDSNHPQHPDFEYYIIPYFERTRIVSVEEDTNGRKYLK
jgi:hypothetical protein